MENPRRKTWGYERLEDEDMVILSFKEMFKLTMEVVDSWNRDALSRQLEMLHEKVGENPEFKSVLERCAADKYELIKNIIMWKYGELKSIRLKEHASE